MAILEVRGEDGEIDFEARAVAGRGALPIRPGASWEIGLVAPGWWAAPVVVDSGEPTPIQLRAYRTGWIEGGFRYPGGVDRPSVVELEATFSATGTSGLPNRDSAPAGRVPCEVRGSSWSCEVPAVALDVVLRPRGFVPRYLWERSIEVDSRHSVGAVRLLAGASVSGRLTVEDGEVEESEIVARLIPEGSEALEGAARRELEARSNDHGFFQFEVVPVGSYRLEAEREGYVRATLRGVVVLPALEAQIQDPLVLRRPESVQVSVSPRRSPAGDRWAIKLWSTDDEFGNHTYDFEGTVDWEGWWTLEGAPAGAYQLALIDADGQRFFSREVEVSPQLGVLEVQVPIVPVEGIVRLGDEPLAAKLSFGGRFGAEVVRLRSDEEGRFSGLLARTGDWELWVEAEEPPVQSVQAVTVVQPDERLPAELEVHVPWTELRGTVKTEMGEDVPSLVTARSLSTWKIVQQRVGSDGGFVIVGLPEGPVRVEAAARGNLATGPELLELSAERSPVELDLTLRKGRAFVGRVLTSEGVPVPGAEVLAYPAHDPLHTTPRMRTDADGMFRAQVPAGSPLVRLVVDAPGFSLKSLRLPLLETGVTEIVVSQRGGSLTVDLPARASRKQGESGLFVRHGGSVWSEAALRRRGQRWPEGAAADDTLRIPALEEGLYEACWIEPTEWLDLATGGTLPSGCASGILAVGGELRLRVSPSSSRR